MLQDHCLFSGLWSEKWKNCLLRRWLSFRCISKQFISNGYIHITVSLKFYSIFQIQNTGNSWIESRLSWQWNLFSGKSISSSATTGVNANLAFQTNFIWKYVIISWSHHIWFIWHLNISVSVHTWYHALSINVEIIADGEMWKLDSICGNLLSLAFTAVSEL